jgi:hypothetical protein
LIILICTIAIVLEFVIKKNGGAENARTEVRRLLHKFRYGPNDIKTSNETEPQTLIRTITGELEQFNNYYTLKRYVCGYHDPYLCMGIAILTVVGIEKTVGIIKFARRYEHLLMDYNNSDFKTRYGLYIFELFETIDIELSKIADFIEKFKLYITRVVDREKHYNLYALSELLDLMFYMLKPINNSNILEFIPDFTENEVRTLIKKYNINFNRLQFYSAYITDGNITGTEDMKFTKYSDDSIWFKRNQFDPFENNAGPLFTPLIV